MFRPGEAGLQNAVPVTTAAEPATTGDGTVAATAVHKCCGLGEVLYADWCRSANTTGHGPWAPEFTASYDDEAVAGLKTLPASSVSYK